jgi:protein TonB
MRIILPESARPRKRAVGGTFASAILHVTVIAGTIAATGWTAEAPRPAPAKPMGELVFIPRPKPPKPASTSTGPVIPTNVVPRETPPVVPLTFEIPIGLPPASTIIGTVAIDSFVRMPVTNGGTGSMGATIASESPMTAAAVDRIVVPLPGNAPPRYPAILASAGIEGEVIMQYVVDTLGRVERGSVRATRGDRPAFEQAVRDALERMTFVPAEAAGRKVRQLVEQTFTFALGRR